MAHVQTRNLSMEYQLHGPRHQPIAVLTMGLGGQLIHWPNSLCDLLNAAGISVLRYDNRDAGLSTHLTEPPPDLLELAQLPKEEAARRVPYNLFDMADDLDALLQALEIDCVHLVGASMGGTISQMFAATHPEKCRSLTLIMSTTGHPSLPVPSPRLLQSILQNSNGEQSLDAHIERGVRVREQLMSPDFPTSREQLIDETRLAVERCPEAHSGRLRQMAAALVAPDTRFLINGLDLPVEILHGRADPLIAWQAAEDLSLNTRNSNLTIVEGMAHDFPQQLMPLFADTILQAVRRSLS